MSWTVSYQSVKRHPLTPMALEVVVEFSDGKKTVDHTLSTRNLTDEQFLRQIQGLIDSLTQVDLTLANPPAPGTPVDLSPIQPKPDVPKTQAQIDRDAFEDALRAWVAAKRSVEAKAPDGTTTLGTPADVDAAYGAMKRLYKEEYQDLLVRIQF